MTFIFIFIGILFAVMLTTIIILASKVRDLKERLDRLKTKTDSMQKRLKGFYTFCGRYHGKQYFTDLYEKMMDALLNKQDVVYKTEEFEGWLKKNPYINPSVSVLDTKQVIIGVDLAESEKEKKK